MAKTSLVPNREKFLSMEEEFSANDECAFCREKGHWKKDCSKLNNKEKTNANVIQNGDDDSESCWLPL